MAFDLQSGAQVIDVEVFRTSQRRAPNPKNSLASPTPIAADGFVYVHFGAEGTAALRATGEIVWKTRLTYTSQHGGGGSPALYKDLLIVNADGDDDAFVAGLDRTTGKTRWRTGRREPFAQAYVTPLVIRVGERDQVVSVGAYRAAAYDPATGREIWRVTYGDGFSNVPRPVFGHGLVYIATGFHQPTVIAVRPDGTGDVTRTHVAWTVSRGAPLTPSPLLVGDDLYFVSDIGVASCVDARTGALHWQQRIGGNYSASPVFAEGRIYFQSEEGVTTVVAPERQFRRLAVSQLDGATLASMAVVPGAFLLRSQTHLYRIGLTK
jgi:outer membrane protein assembly factor BamB